MLDEFEDGLELDDLPRSSAQTPTAGGGRPRAARLVSRLYRAAGAPLRSRMIACLVRPLGSLGLAGVASGAFAGLLPRGADTGPVGDLAAYSSEQIFELARFVEQVSPDALQQVAGLLADNPVAASAFSTAAVMLLVRIVRGLRAKGRQSQQPAAAARTEVAAGGIAQARTTCGHGAATALEEMVRRSRQRPGDDAAETA